MPDKPMTLGEPTDLLIEAQANIKRATTLFQQRELRLKELADTILYGAPTRDVTEQLRELTALLAQGKAA